MCKWCRNKIRRRIKKDIFGDPDITLDEFEVAGINIGSIKDILINNDKTSLKLNKHSNKSLKKIEKPSKDLSNKRDSSLAKPIKTEKKPTIPSILKKMKSLSIDSTPVKEIIRKGKSVYEDFMERDLGLGISKDSNLKITQSEKERIKKYSDDTNKHKIAAFFGDMQHEDVKKKFSLTKSKSKILKNMVEDYKKGKKLSALLKKSNVRLDLLDKNELNTVLNEYKANKEKKESDIYRNLENLKEKIPLSKSRADILENMIKDYKAHKISLSDIPYLSKLNVSDLNREKLNKLLDEVKDSRTKKNHVPFVKQSKLKQWKSDIGAKLNTLVKDKI